MNQVYTIVGLGLITMTSREIAELTGKRHPDVKRDIENMLKELAEDVSSFSRIYTDSMNREQSEFALDRELTETLLTGYSASLRRKVIARWRELESRAEKPKHLIPQSLPEALRLAADLADQRDQAHAELALQAPKIAALDLISTRAEGSLCITNAAKDLQVQPKRLFQWMQAHDWIYRRAGGSGYVAHQHRIKVGYLEHKVTTIERSDGTSKMVEQVLVTAKGLAKLAGEKLS